MYTIFQTAAAAITVNAAAAEAAGCDMVATLELHNRIQHPTDGRWALEDGTGPVTREQMIADGWFTE
jgi:hypothetical protein